MLDVVTQCSSDGCVLHEASHLGIQPTLASLIKFFLGNAFFDHLVKFFTYTLFNLLHITGIADGRNTEGGSFLKRVFLKHRIDTISKAFVLANSDTQSGRKSI